MPKSQKGSIPPMLLAALGILVFLFITNAFSFKDRLFNKLFPKPPSYAQEQASSSVPAPSGLNASVVSSSQINLSWNPSTDNAEVTGYNIYRNTLKVATVTSNSYGDGNLVSGTTYSYFVKSFDAKGNTSVSSNPVSATTESPSQLTTGIKGTVFSSAGGVVAKVITTASGSKKTIVTSSTGAYTFTQIPAGTYSVEFEAQGYVTQTVNITVIADQLTIKDVTLAKR